MYVYMYVYIHIYIYICGGYIGGAYVCPHAVRSSPWPVLGSAGQTDMGTLRPSNASLPPTEPKSVHWLPAAVAMRLTRA